MDRADDKADVKPPVTMRHGVRQAWTNWQVASGAGHSICPLCGRPDGTAFADDTWICCLPISPLPYFY